MASSVMEASSSLLGVLMAEVVRKSWRRSPEVAKTVEGGMGCLGEGHVRGVTLCLDVTHFGG